MRMPAPAAAAVAKVAAFEELSPRLFGCLLCLAGVFLVAAALDRPKRPG